MTLLPLLALLVLACAPEPELDSPSQAERSHSAGLLLDRGRYEEAAAIFQDLYAEGYEPARLGWGIALRGLGRLDESLWCLEGAPSEDLAFTLYALDRNLEAAAVFGQLLDEDPLCLWNLAAALDAAGKPTEALVLEVASRLNPYDSLQGEVLAALATAQAQRGDVEQARATFAHAEYLESRGENDGR